MDAKEQDIQLWKEYKATNSPLLRDKLLGRMAGLIQSSVNKWAGTLPIDVLKTKASILAIKSFDTFDPNRGVALSTHVVNNLAPLSRLIYTYSNTARVPENIALKINTFNQAVDHLTTLYGRQPNTEELHSFTGFGAQDINKLRTMGGKDLIESGGNISSSFYSDKEDTDSASIDALYFSLSPDEKILFECTTGYGGHQVLNNAEIIDKLHMSQAQVSYKKTQLATKLKSLIHGK